MKDEKKDIRTPIEMAIDSARVEIEKAMTDTYPGISYEGKKLRGALSVIVSDCFSGDHEKAVKYGAAVEFVHQGSIYHDDVLDEHMTRRGRPSMMIAEGIKKALLMGDIMFSSAMSMAADGGSEEAKAIAKAMSITLKGVMEEVSVPNAIDIILTGKVEADLYYKIIDMKTAALFATSAKFGIMSFTDKQDWIDSMFAWGQYVGRAYQIADDLVDIDGLSTGKVEASPAKIAPIVPAIVKYNSDILKRAPFQLLRGNVGLDTLLGGITELNMTEKMITDIKTQLKQADLILEDYGSAIKDKCVLKQYPIFAINKMLEEIGEKI